VKQITGVDPETRSVESAAQFAGQSSLTNVKFEQGDGNHLKYEDNQFETLMCQKVLTHVRDAETVVREMARVLKPGGIFMAAEYSDDGALIMYDNVDTPNNTMATRKSG
jgi:ubiquinone/menaquinone biosynthesis C-methylase UbiE